VNLVYTRNGPCEWCDKAKELLDNLGIKYTIKVVGIDISKEDFLALGFPTKTVPQVILVGKYIGTYDNLKQWYEEVYNAYGENSH